MEDNNSPESPIMPLPEDQKSSSSEMGVNTNSATKGGKVFMENMTRPETVQKTPDDPSIGRINGQEESNYKPAGNSFEKTSSDN